MAIYLSIIIPAFNEEGRIEETLRKIHSFRERNTFQSEVIVVDDHSQDRTSSIVEKFIQGRDGYRLITLPQNRGKGAAVRRGMEAATGSFRLFSDADLSTPIEQVSAFFPLLRGGAENQTDVYDVVIGSRRVKGARVEKRQPLLRELCGRVFGILVRVLTLRGFIDTQCGFKIFTATAAQEIFRRQTIDRFGFDVEILFIALRKGFRVKEAPVVWYDSPFTRVRVLQDSTRMFFDLLRIPRNHFHGRYH